MLVETLGPALTGEPVRLAALDMLGRIGGLTFVGVFAGLGLGAAQWLALRAAAPVARRWVVWCVVGFAAGLPAGSLAAEFVGGLQSPVGFATFLGVAGLTLGAFTARSGVRRRLPPDSPLDPRTEPGGAPPATGAASSAFSLPASGRAGRAPRGRHVARAR